MKLKESENLNKEELFENIKNRYAKKANKELFLSVPAIYLFTVNDMKPALYMLLFLLLAIVCCVIDYWRLKKPSRFEDAKDLLNWYHQLSTKKWKLSHQILTTPVFLALGYLMGIFLWNTHIKNLDLGWYLLATLFLIAYFVFALFIYSPKYKGERFKDEGIENLQELIEKE